MIGEAQLLTDCSAVDSNILMCDQEYEQSIRANYMYTGKITLQKGRDNERLWGTVHVFYGWCVRVLKVEYEKKRIKDISSS